MFTLHHRVWAAVHDIETAHEFMWIFPIACSSTDQVPRIPLDIREHTLFNLLLFRNGTTFKTGYLGHYTYPEETSGDFIIPTNATSCALVQIQFRDSWILACMPEPLPLADIARDTFEHRYQLAEYRAIQIP